MEQSGIESPNNKKGLKMKLVKIKRQSYDIGIFGKKGSFKTTVLTLLGALHQRYNKAIVFSNYPLNFPHIFIDNLEDLNKIYEYPQNKPKVFLGDDLERWFHSRAYKSRVNTELNSILLDFGKISCSVLYTAKRSMTIDIGLRDATSEFWFTEGHKAYYSEDETINKKLENYLNFIKIKIIRFDENLEELPSITIENIPLITPLFDTHQIIHKIG